MQQYPLICAGIQQCTTTTNPLRWRGDLAQRNDNLLGECDFGRYIGDDCTIIGVYVGTHDDEWAIHFDWSDLNSDYVVQEFWAEAWYDYETEDYHCCVRDVRRGNHLYGPNPTQPYYKAPPQKSLKDFAEMLETGPWDNLHATTSLDAERARSRAYKAWRKRTLPLAMALHGRLGAGSSIACLGGDLMAEVVKWV